MAISRPFHALIADPDGHALTAFLQSSPADWATNAMLTRYGQPAPDEAELDDSVSVAAKCYRALLAEYHTAREWFTDDGVLSPLLQAPWTAKLMSAPIADGLGWDFRPDGTAEPELQQFKGQLIFSQRSAKSLPFRDRHVGNLQFAGLMRLIRAAYTSRAKLHTWKPILRKDPAGAQVVAVPADALAHRWIAFRTFSFLVQIGCDPYTSWYASKAHQALGPVDEDRSIAPNVD